MLKASKDLGASLPHPWLQDVPIGLSRLVDIGKVRMQVDEAAVQAAHRTALTAFQFTLHYRMRYRQEDATRQKKPSKSVKLFIRFVDAEWDIEHRVILSEQFRPNRPWESALLLHEFDHVAISTDPRLLAMIGSLKNATIELLLENSPSEGLSQQRIEGEVQAYINRFQKSIEELVNTYYRELDKESNNGLVSIRDRSRFFKELYQLDRLQREKYEFLDLIKLNLKKVEQAKVDQHYRIP